MKSCWSMVNRQTARMKLRAICCPTSASSNRKGAAKAPLSNRASKSARGDIIVMLDADGSTDPAEIPAFVSALLSGADFAKGSRFAQGGGTADMPWYRRWGNRCFVWMVRLLFGGAYSDLCYGYNAFWSDVLPLIHLDADGFEVETTMNVRALYAGLKVVEVPSFEDKRIYGEGRLKTIPDGWRVLKAIGREWRTARHATVRAARATRIARTAIDRRAAADNRQPAPRPTRV